MYDSSVAERAREINHSFFVFFFHTTLYDIMSSGVTAPDEEVAYFFSYQTVFFPFQDNFKNLDPSYKMDLDLWDCLGRVKLVL